MSRYSYVALDKQNQKVKGTLSVENGVELKNEMINCGYQLIRYHKVSFVENLLHLKNKKLSTEIKLSFCQYFYQMEKAGINPLENLQYCIEALEDPFIGDQLRIVQAYIARGKSLSDAFKKCNGAFDAVFNSLLKVGEAMGNLSFAFEKLIKHYKWQIEFQNSVKQSLRYPLFVLGVINLLLYVLVTFLFPQMKSFLLNLGSDLPFISMLFMEMTEFLGCLSFIILGIGVGGTMLFVGYHISYYCALKVDEYMLSLPMISKMIKAIKWGRFLHVLGVLLRGDVPLLQALDVAGKVLKNKYLEKLIEEVKTDIHHGERFAKAMKKKSVLFSPAVNMLDVGEKTGQLVDSLENAESFYKMHLSQSKERLTSYLEPIMLLIVGGLILLMAMAVFLPIYENLTMIDV